MAGKTNNTKNDIIQLTIRKISENGSQQISLRSLLGELNLTTGSFYKHFQNKHDLFASVTQVVSSRLGRQAKQTIEGQHLEPLDSLVALGKFMVNQFDSQPYLMDFLFFNSSAINIYHSTESATKFPLLAYPQELITQIMNQYQLSESPENLFIKIWAFIQGYGILIRNHAITFDEALLKESAKALIGVN